jgi:hypothetical protein
VVAPFCIGAWGRAESRKLVAIFAADVVGFSRLTGADEQRTLVRLRALRSDLIDPAIAVHNGRVVKRTGDGRRWSNSVASSTLCAAGSRCNKEWPSATQVCRRTGGLSFVLAFTSAMSSRRRMAT